MMTARTLVRTQFVWKYNENISIFKIVSNQIFLTLTINNEKINIMNHMRYENDVIRFITKQTIISYFFYLK